MHLDNFNDDIWDEYQWENHINEIEEKSDQLKEFINSTWGESTPSWLRFLNEYNSELEAVDAYIEEELLFEEAYFPDDDDELESDDDDVDDDLFFGQDDDSFYDYEEEEDDLFDEDDDDDDDYLEGEDWKSESEEFVMSDYGSIDNLRIYNEARNLGAYLLRFADRKSVILQNAPFVQFVTDVLQISCKLAAGYSFGFDKDVLGANITYTKKALLNANRSLNHIQLMKNKNIFRRDEYYKIHEWLFELRNDIGVYIQDMRDQFYNSI